MNKKLIAMAIAGVFAVPMAAQAEGVAISGFADIIFDADSSSFGADAEIDFIKTVGAVTGRLDIDADLVLNDGNGSAGIEQALFAWGVNDTVTLIGGVFNNPIGQDAEDAPDMNFTTHSAVYNILNHQTALDGNNIAGIEQALFAWGVNDTVTLIGGVFNNPIGQDAEDAPDMNFTTHTAVYNILDHQTALDGNNIAGIAGAFNFGAATLTVAFLNDIQQVTDENSVAAVLNLSLVEGLALELGYVTQETGAENVANLNASYTTGAFTLGLDYLAPDEIIDSAYNVWVGYGAGDFGVKVFTEAVAWDAGGDDTTNSGIYGSYQLNDNLAAAIQYSTGDDNPSLVGHNLTTGINDITGINTEDTTTLEFIVSF